MKPLKGVRDWQSGSIAMLCRCFCISRGDVFKVGSLNRGKKADIIIVNLQDPSFFPIYTKPIRNIVPNLVYSARGHEVETSIIDGKVVMENRKILTIDELSAIETAQKVAEEIAIRSEKDILEAKSDILDIVTEGLL